MFTGVKTAFDCLNAEMKVAVRGVHCHVAAAFGILPLSQ